MRLVITRHGQTDENLRKIILGQEIDAPLNQDGIEQARKLAERLKDEEIHIAYTSDMERAVQTAEEILRFHSPVKLATASALREWKAGVYSGQLMEEGNKEKDRERSGLPFDVFKPQNGESYVELQERLKPFLRMLLQKHKKDSVLIVSHAVTVTVLLLTILDLPITKENYRKWRPANVSVNICEVSENGETQLCLFNDTEHLGSAIEVL